MNEKEIKKRIEKIIYGIIGKDLNLDENDSLLIFGLDSMTMLRLIIELEEEFCIEIEDDDLDMKNFETIDKIKKFILKKCKRINEKSMSEKIVVITGANRGIGYGIAKVLCEKGYRVIALNKTSYKCEYYHEIICDLNLEGDIINAANNISNSYGRVDILVNNAGIRKFSRIDRIALSDWDLSFRTNLTAPLLLAQKLIKPLVRAEGIIIFIGSSAAANPIEGGVAYCCTKTALQMLAEVCIQDLRYEGVRACCLSLGATNVNSKDYPSEDWKINAEDIGDMISFLSNFSHKVMPAYIDLRPSYPKKSDIVGLEKLQYI